MPSPVSLPEPWSHSQMAVVVPTYNEAENLPVLVDQVMALDLPGLRMVVVDDGSDAARARHDSLQGYVVDGDARARARLPSRCGAPPPA